ncbi:MAG: glyceraldehyde-3-phosphate dehydrogenase [Firmicutes bacterium]|nr:glyceraldehyde-3-phosphate dehydrogenase [Bacillota bacterium]
MRLAINGMGRVGRLLLRQLARCPEVELVAVNDLMPAKTLAHLVRHDSVHGWASFRVRAEGETLWLGDRPVPVFQEADPTRVPFPQRGAEGVVECTGRFTDRAGALLHLRDGVKHVVVSAFMTDPDFTVLPGLNDAELDLERHRILAMGSAASHGLAMMAEVLHRGFGLRHGLFTVVQSYTSDQSLLDLPHEDPRRARAASQSMIPARTTAARSVDLALPALRGRLAGTAVRVPTPDGLLTDLTAWVERGITAEAVNGAFREAAQGPLNGLLEVLDEELVSTDLLGMEASCLFDPFLTRVMEGPLVKIHGWCDNEWAYVTRLRELLLRLEARP